MRKRDLKALFGRYVFIILGAAMLLIPASGMAANWWEVTPEEENPSPPVRFHSLLGYRTHPA